MYHLKTKNCPAWNAGERLRVARYLERLGREMRNREGELDMSKLDSMSDHEIARLAGLEADLAKAEGSLPRTPWMTPEERVLDRRAEAWDRDPKVYEQARQSVLASFEALMGGK